ncbi:MAG: chlorophyll synthase ChlG [Ardenticatenales bacterium]|nr:chlorophyll synthase ChlG [Ardenticatenales bacterium]
MSGDSVSTTAQQQVPLTDAPPALLVRSFKLMKPVTWFGPMWAFLCGTIASGATSLAPLDILRVLLGMVLAGPILCGFSQVLNDYFDREVDAINEPHRLIPSGLVSLRQVWLTIALLLLSGVALAWWLGDGVTLLVIVGLLFAVAYSAPPIRAKRNGWIGNGMVALSYEGLAWMAGHVAFAALTPASIFVALAYSFGAHGIMTINDFKSMAGDKLKGVRSLPVQYGPEVAAWLIVVTMNMAQIVVAAFFMAQRQWLVAAIIAALVVAQYPLQRRFLRDPVKEHIFYSASGVSLFVWGMMAAAVGLRYM